MFLDEVELSVSAGRGGPGSASMHSEKFAPRGGPDGGDGGRGGDVVALADSSLNSLQRYQLARSFKAAGGGAGGPSRRHGADGKSSTLSVPPGTLAWDVATGQLLADLDRPGATAVLARGGKGGRGNVHFTSPIHQAPRRRELGEPGVTRAIRLELRLIADIGLVGLPNAGKSTLLARLTGARPKIAAYPFTTLSPNLGVADVGRGRVLTLADVPGLIEGAHQGAGLGLSFLKHLARTRALVHLVDASLGEEAIIAAYRQVTAEMQLHSPELSTKPTLLALNKLDLIDSGEGTRLRIRLAEVLPKSVSVLGLSAATGAGCPELLAAAEHLLSQAPGPPPEDRQGGGFRLYQGPRGLSREFSVERVGDTFRVAGESLERLIAVTDLDDDSSVLRLQRQLAKIGVEAALLHAGAKEGDEVQIGEEAFTFYPDPTPARAGVSTDDEQPGNGVPDAPHNTILFGGTFDPPHLGHLSVIRGLRRQTGLPILVVPTGAPGHRPPPQASPSERAEMVELAIRALDDPLVTVSRHEAEQSQLCFTVDTVEWLRSRQPELSVVLALGSDVAATLLSWKQVSRLLAQVRLLVFERPGAGEPGESTLAELRRRQLPLAGAEVISISAPVVDATSIREKLAKRESCAELLPPGVEEYIRSHCLYSGGLDPGRSPREG